MLVVTDRASSRALEVFECLVDLGVDSVAFSPFVRGEDNVASDRYRRFLLDFYEAWLAHDGYSMQVRNFDVGAALALGRDAGICEYDGTCGRHPTLDVDGKVYACDFLTGQPSWCLGSLVDSSLDTMLRGERLRTLRHMHHVAPEACSGCSISGACSGGCPVRRRPATLGRDVFCDTHLALSSRVASSLQMAGVTSPPPLSGCACVVLAPPQVSD